MNPSDMCSFIPIKFLHPQALPPSNFWHTVIKKKKTKTKGPVSLYLMRDINVYLGRQRSDLLAVLFQPLNICKAKKLLFIVEDSRLCNMPFLVRGGSPLST